MCIQLVLVLVVAEAYYYKFMSKAQHIVKGVENVYLGSNPKKCLLVTSKFSTVPGTQQALNKCLLTDTVQSMFCMSCILLVSVCACVRVCAHASVLL